MSREDYVRVSINRDFPDGGHNGGGFATKIPHEVNDDFQPFSEKQHEIASRIWQILELIGVSWHIAMLDAMRLPQITKAVAILSDAWLESDRSNEFDDCCQFFVRLERLLLDLNPSSELTTEQKRLVSKLIEQGAIVMLFDRVLTEDGLDSQQRPRVAPVYSVGCSVGCCLSGFRGAYTVDRIIFNAGSWWYWLADEAGDVSICAKEADLYLLIAD